MSSDEDCAHPPKPKFPRNIQPRDFDFDLDKSNGNLNLFKLGRLIANENDAFDVAQKLGLIPKFTFCDQCHHKIDKVRLKRTKNRPDRKLFYCARKQCKGQWSVSVKKNTVFQGLKSPIGKVITVTYCFSVNFTVSQTLHESSLCEEATSRECVADLFSYLREVCAEAIYNKDLSGKIGGPNLIVEIDEAKFDRRTCEKGRIANGQWVLGAVCKETKEFFLLPIEDRAEDTLLSVIEKHVEKGTILHTDCLKSVGKLNELEFRLRAISHSGSGVAHGQPYRTTWWTVRRGLPLFLVEKKLYGQHLAEYIWRKTYTYSADIFLQLCHDIKQMYSASKPQAE